MFYLLITSMKSPNTQLQTKLSWNFFNYQQLTGISEDREKTYFIIIIYEDIDIFNIDILRKPFQSEQIQHKVWTRFTEEFKFIKIIHQKEKSLQNFEKLSEILTDYYLKSYNEK